MRVVLALIVVVVARVMCDDDPPRGTVTPFQTQRRQRPDAEEDHDHVENTFCDYVINREAIHLPAFSDQHHRLLEIHVRSNLHVRINRFNL